MTDIANDPRPAVSCRILLGSLTLVAFLVGCAASEDEGTKPGAQTSYRNLDLASVLGDVRQRAERREAAVAHCEDYIVRRPNAFPFESLVVGLLDVAEEEAKSAFCQALVEGVIANDITEANIAVFQQRRRGADKAPLGSLLRGLIVAYERLRSQQAQAREHQPAGSPQ